MKNIFSKVTDRFISPDDTLLLALKRMDTIDKKLLLIVENEKFVGLISVGDIQRMVLKGNKLTTKVKDAVRKNIKVAFAGEDMNVIKKQMIKFRMELMPVVDDKMNLVDILLWEDIFETKVISPVLPFDIPVVIMAGGIGSRMKPLTNIIPKPLLPYKNKSVIDEIILRFLNAGCSEFIISAYYKAEFIKLYFDLITDKNYKVDFVFEKKPLGTAGSLKMLNDKIKTPFFVTNCDILLSQDYAEIYNYHIKNKNVLTIVGSLKSYDIPYGILKTGNNGNLISINEKPTLTHFINSGIYLMDPFIFSVIPDNAFFNITDLIELLKKKKKKIGVFPVSEGSLLDFGNWEDYSKSFRKDEYKI